MSSVVLDASALLALLNEESGSDRVAHVLRTGAAIGTINVSEVAAKLSEAGMPEAAIRTAIDGLGLEVIDFDLELAYRSGLLRPLTKNLSLSLGDRACLALAQARGEPAVTADRSWTRLDLGIIIQVIR